MDLLLHLLLCALSVRMVAAIDCYNYIETLCKEDMIISSRQDMKHCLVGDHLNATEDEFVETMEVVPSIGHKASCGNTRGWVCEVYEGLRPQYNEVKYTGEKAGFINYIGQDLVDLFDKNLHSDNIILYKMQIVGPLDHVWLIEQHPGNEYRVYQSYNGAYSLYAWLSDNTAGMFGTHIIVWDDVITMANDFLISYGCTLWTVEDCPDGVTDGALGEWLVYIRDYNEEEIMKNFETAWEHIGKGVLLDKADFYDMYLYKLSELTASIESMVGTTTLWTQHQHDTWISLFASPNPLCYPGVPFNMLTPTTNGPYEMQVKVDAFGADSMLADCDANFIIIGESVPNWRNTMNAAGSFSSASLLRACMGSIALGLAAAMRLY